ncbi:hypothetical protein [Rhizobium leguminosarum]|uniref:hypothetical protein n=1 Tax=Rhizobium leguminosarum TaxID=384 RepID=UPI0010372E0D|nr:hypothetical protein [Rhizobium leguminosarum]TBF85693.1 hypothetical protein ELG85_37170 [Rhizobium leguminosarum]
MFQLSAELKAKGEKAEVAFRAWLNQSGVPYLYVEQSRLNVPVFLRGRIKRPDYIVGIPFAGSMAFDVKAKSAYAEQLLFPLDEVEKLARFSAHFHVSLYFACLDVDVPERFYWVPLRDLVNRTPERRGKARVVAFPIGRAFEVRFDEPFLDAYLRFSANSLAL